MTVSGCSIEREVADYRARLGSVLTESSAQTPSGAFDHQTDDSSKKTHPGDGMTVYCK